MVADARSVAEEMFDGHVVADQREIVAEDGASARGQLERAILDEAHDGQRDQAFGTACDPELAIN